MKIIQLGELEKVKVWDFWEHEAHDFCAWLAIADNLAQLSDAIGLKRTQVIGF